MHQAVGLSKSNPIKVDPLNEVQVIVVRAIQASDLQLCLEKI